MNETKLMKALRHIGLHDLDVLDRLTGYEAAKGDEAAQTLGECARYELQRRYDGLKRLAAEELKGGAR